MEEKRNKSAIGLIGLGAMGTNLARNIANKKFRTLVYNRTTEKTKKFIKEYGSEYLDGETNLKTFVLKLERPRKIIIMVKAGVPVDVVIKQLLPHLDKNDIIIDCGNSNYKDTQRRFEELIKKKIDFIGCGVSGGELGALNGPSIMPGGSKSAFKKIEPIFKKIAAKDFGNKPTLAYIGDNGAGHFVKMAHNGIEYGVMQIMAEAYDILRTANKLKAPEIAKIFAKFNKGKLSSYLFDISTSVLSKKDNKGYLVDNILDKAAQKGTGRWTAIASLENSVSFPTLAEAVSSRVISNSKKDRIQNSTTYNKAAVKHKVSLKTLENAIYSAILITYAQGYDLIIKTAKEEKWKINLSEISRIWEGGCIIRAKLLNFLHKAYKKSDKHLFQIPAISKELKNSINDLRFAVTFTSQNSIPAPGLSSALTYFDSLTSKNLPANFVQGLRDYFGAHTYERTDKKGHFHTDWQ